MPLIHSKSKPAFKKNVETLMDEVGIKVRTAGRFPADGRYGVHALLNDNLDKELLGFPAYCCDGFCPYGGYPEC